MNSSAGYSKKNIIAGTATQIVLFAVNFFITPYVIHTYGVSLFGVVVLCGQLIVFIEQYLNSFVAAVQRDAAHADTYPDPGPLLKIMDTTRLLAIYTLVPLFVIAIVVLAIVIPMLVDGENIFICRISFIIMFLGQLAYLLVIPNEVIIFLSGKLYLLSRASLFIQTGLIFVFAMASGFGAGSLLLWVICSTGAKYLGVLYIYKSRFRGEENLLKKTSMKIDTVEASKLLKFTMLIAMGGFGSLLFYSVDSIIISSLPSMSMEDVTYYRVAQKWDVVIRMVVVGISAGAMPKLMKLLANNSLPELILFVSKCCKAIVIFVCLPCTFLLVYADEFLTVWLGPVFAENSGILLRIIMIQLIICAPGRIFHGINVGTRLMKFPVKIVTIFGVLNIPISVFLAENVGMGLKGIAFASVFCMITATVINSLHALHASHVKFRTAFRGTTLCYLFVGLGFVVKHYLLLFCGISGYFSLLVHIGLFSIIYIFYVWCLVLSKQERESVISETILKWRQFV